MTGLQESVTVGVNQDGQGPLVMMVDIYNVMTHLEDHNYYPNILLNREAIITLLS